jgi:hypothetical protein
MTINANYLAHRVITPPDYQRRYDHDLPSQVLPSSAETVKRVALLILPFVGLQKQCGFAISVGMGGCRVVSHMAGMYQAGGNRAWGELSYEAAQTALAVMAISAIFFHFTLGSVITTGVDACTAFIQACQYGSRKEYGRAAEELLQGVGSLFQLAIMATGAWEIIVISALLQGVISLIQARGEFTKGRYPEAIAKTLLSAIRLHQAKGHWDSLQKRNALLAFEEFKKLAERVREGREAGHLIDSPLGNLQGEVAQRRVVLTNAQNQPYDFGSHFHGFGKGTVKGANLCFRNKNEAGQEVIELDMRINHVFRKRLERLFDQMKNVDEGQLKEMLALSHSHASDIRFEQSIFPVGQKVIGPSQRIVFEGVGSITIGSSPDFPNLHGRLIIQMDAKKPIFAMHEMLALLDLTDTLKTSTQEDLVRLKIGHLFRTFYPREATPFERSDAFFELPIEDLKAEIVKRAPEMKTLFETYLDRMEAREILPGRMRYAIPGLADRARAEGAQALIAGISSKNQYEDLASVLKMGLLSSDMRFTNGIGVDGLSSYADFFTGGNDSVFSQLATKKYFEPDFSLQRDNFYGFPLRLVLSLDALETGTYQYYKDMYGSRETDSPDNFYFHRPGFHEFFKEASFTQLSSGHEIMIKERIPSSLIQGILVENEIERVRLLEYLRLCSLIEKDSSGNETILNTSIDQFVRVSS